MKRTTRIFAMAATLTMTAAGTSFATPSTQIWIPSTDVQGYKTLHLGIDNYTRVHRDGVAGNVYDLGVTAGILPYEKIQAEVGVDFITNDTTLDNHPLYFNGKLATPEDALFKNSPALAVGGFGFGTNGATVNNIGYALAAKTLPVVGRFSAGYYLGNDNVLVDVNGDKDNKGVLLSWDRTLSEISDKLWVAVDYQGGKNAFGALSFGAAWAFSKNVSVIFGYDFYNAQDVAGKNTFTTQLDINFP